MQIKALVDLSRCAKANNDLMAATRHAQAAVDLAQAGTGPDHLGYAMAMLAETQHASGDLGTAAVSAEQALAALRRGDSPNVLYETLRLAVLIALDRKHVSGARALCPELRQLAHDLDRKNDATHRVTETLDLLERLPKPNNGYNAVSHQ